MRTINELRTTLVAFLFIGMLFIGMVGISDKVSAQDYSGQSVASLDGYIEARGTIYPGTPYYNDTNDDYILVGQFRGSGPTYYKYQERGFLSFNTSEIPDDAVIQQVSLKLRVYGDMSYVDFGVEVYEADYGTSLRNEDFNSYSTYQGQLLNTAGITIDTWYSMNLWANSIDPTGISQYMLKSNRDNTTSPSTYEYILFYSGDEYYAPVLEIWYALGGTTLSIELSSGSYLNSTVYADIGDWNLTYDLWTFEFDTVPNSVNASLELLNTSWEFVGLAPNCNYSVTTDWLILEDIYDSICYRVWFAIPKVNPYTTVHLRLFNSFTGEGFFWEQMKVQICDGSSWDNGTAEDVSQPDFYVEPELNYTIRILDYFNNMLVDYSFLASSQDVFLSIPVPYYSWQVFNMNEQPILMKIYWNNSGSPLEFFVGPSSISEKWLKGGNYTFMVTFYDVDDEGDLMTGSTVYYEQTIPLPGLNASFIYVKGTNLTQIATDIEGIYALQEIITQQLSPSVLWIGRDVPQIPSYLLTVSAESIINNLYMISAMTIQSGNGTTATFESPFPITAADTEVESDIVRFVGSYYTRIYINDTETSTTFYSSTTLPASISLTGSGAYTVWTNSSISCTREVDFRWYKMFTYTYEPSIEEYNAEITITNNLATAWLNATMFIPFMNGSYVNNRSVEIWDMNNTVPLTEGIHWIQCEDGVYMWFPQLNSSVVRGFRLTYTAVNETNLEFPVHITVNGVGNADSITYSWQGDLFYFAEASWTNDYRERYHGSIYIDLTFSMSVDPDSVVVLKNGAPMIDVIVAGKTIIIQEEIVEVGDAVSYIILFKTEQTESVFSIGFAGVPLISIISFIALVSFILAVFFVQFRKDKQSEMWGRTLIGVAVLCIALIIIVFIYALGT